MATLREHPSTLPPIPAVTRILAGFDRPKLEGFVEVAIGLLDVRDGDADEEWDPRNEGEPAFDQRSFSFLSQYADGPGDSVSDPGGGNVDDGGERDLGDEGEPEFGC